MIVFGTSLVLPADTADFGRNHPYVCWHNVVTTANIYAGSITSAMKAANPSLAEYWEGTPSAVNTRALSVNLSAYTGQVDYIAIAGHNLGTLGMQVVAQVATSVDGSGNPIFTSVTSTTFVPPDDSPLIFRFTPGNYVAVRVRIQAAENVPKIAVMYVGLGTVLQRKVYVGHPIMTYNSADEILTGRSESGKYLGRIITRSTQRGSIDQSNVTPAFYRSSIEPWRKAVRDKPFFLAWRPFTYPSEVDFTWAAGDMSVNNQLSNGMMSVSLPLEGLS